jgi:hypothetical protein
MKMALRQRVDEVDVADGMDSMGEAVFETDFRRF